MTTGDHRRRSKTGRLRGDSSTTLCRQVGRGGQGFWKTKGKWAGGVLIVCYAESAPNAGNASATRRAIGEKVPAGRMPPNYACGSTAAAAAAGTGRGYVCRWA